MTNFWTGNCFILHRVATLDTLQILCSNVTKCLLKANEVLITAILNCLALQGNIQCPVTKHLSHSILILPRY